MRKIIVSEHTTLDGFFAGPKGEMYWEVRDKEIAQYAQEQANSIDAILFGRVTYELMANYWPTPAATENEPIFANFLNNAHKIVFSKTLKKTNWKNTRLVKEINKEAIMKMKQQSGKNMIMFGSGTIVQQLTNLGLIDEYQLMVNPVILGKGKPLFEDIKDRINLTLLKTKTFSNGVVLLRYRPEREGG